MKASANEVMVLAAKAARGAGAPPAQASAFGRAALCHLAADRSATDLMTALDTLPQGPVISLPLAFATLVVTQTHTGTIRAEAPADLVRSYAEAQPFATSVSLEGDDLIATLDTKTPTARATVARIDLPDGLAHLLNTHAAKILVPENAASRSSGAGAGLNDND